MEARALPQRLPRALASTAMRPVAHRSHDRATPQVRDRKARLWPREHGFWVMLAAVLASALWRGRFELELLLVLVATGLLLALLGGQAGRYVRRRGWIQLFISAALGFTALPAELVSGVALGEGVLRGLGFGAIFATSACGVRAVFERSRHGAPNYAVASLLLPTLATAAFFGLGRVEALGTTLALVTAVILALLRPSIKQLRLVGIALALLAAGAVLLLNLAA